MGNEAAMKKLSEELRKLFPGLVFVPSGSGMDAVAGDLAGTVRTVSTGEAAFRVEIRVGYHVLLLCRYWTPDNGYMLQAERARLLTMRRELGLLLGVADG